MKTIIKKGNQLKGIAPIFSHTCDVCGCVFTYQYEDTIIFDTIGIKVSCPNCGEFKTFPLYRSLASEETETNCKEGSTTTIHCAKYCHENLIHPRAKFSHYDAAKLVPEGCRLMTREDAKKIKNGPRVFDTERNGLWIADKEEDLKKEGKSEFLEADEDGIGRYLLADVDEDGYRWLLYFAQSYVDQSYTNRYNAFSVRCVQI